MIGNQITECGVIARKARIASGRLSNASTSEKSIALVHLAELLESEMAAILAANEIDFEEGKKTLSAAMADRLMLNENRIRCMAADVRSVANLPDPIGEVFEESIHANGMRIEKRRVPIGVVAVIYESRPNVTIDAACLMIKSGNAVILRGGKETIRTNLVLASLVRRSLNEAGLPEDSVQLIESPDRGLVLDLLNQADTVDLVIPRGGSGLHKFCREHSRIPVITGGIGVCHLFVDESVDQTRAIDVIRNAKIQRPTVCNALETMLVHRAIAESFIPKLCADLAAKGVEFRVDARVYQILTDANFPEASFKLAQDGDFDMEWLSLVLSIAVVDDVNSAISHIRTHSTGHSDGILTEVPAHAQQFVNQVNSACVYVNVSTRFTDGSQLGLGAEIAISTQPIHARGPMALRELTTYKWVIRGEYQTRL